MRGNRLTRRIVVAGLLVTGLPGAARAQFSGLVVERRSASAPTVDAGSQLTLVYQISNRGAVPHVATGTLRLPAGWLMVLPASVDSLRAGATALTLLRVVVPRDARAGEYLLRYAVMSPDPGDAALGEDTVRVTVGLRRLLGVALREVPRFVVAGDRYTARFAVHNGGTVPETVRLELRSSDGYAAQLDSGRTMRLEPAEQRLVTATVTTDGSIVGTREHRVQLDASIEGDSTPPVAAVGVVEVVARRAVGASRYRRLPAELALRTGGTGQSLAGELQGGGMVSDAARLQFMARSRSTPGDAFGLQDEYWTQVTTERSSLRLGDQGYQGVRMRETGHPSFGGSGEFTVRALTVAVFASRDRRTYQYTGERQLGGALGLSLGDRATVESGLLSRTGINAGRIWSSRGRIALLPGVSLSGEYGRGNGDSSRGDAYVTALSATRGRIVLNARRESAEPGFPGYWRGTSYSDASVALHVSDALDLIGNANAYEMLDRRSAFLNAGSYQRGAEAGVALFGRRVGATYRAGRVGGGSSGVLTAVPGMAERHGGAVRVFAGMPVGSGTVGGDVEVGQAEMIAAPGARMPFSQIGLRGGLGSPRFSLAAAVQQTNGPSPFTFGTEGQTTASLDGGVRIVGGTRLSLGVSATRYGTPARTFSSLGIGIGQELPFGQRVRYQGRSFATQAGGAPVGDRLAAQQVEYLMPLGIPVGLSQESAAIETRLIDDATGRPVPGVMLRVAGERRLTDARGEARFTRLTAGTYYLTVDREALPRDHIVAPAGPVRVALRTGERRALELRVVGSATVHGVGRRYRYAPTRLGAPDSLVDAGPLANLAILLTNGSDTVHVDTDAQGRFSAPELRAGRWEVSVVAADLPPRHVLAPGRLDLQLSAGEVRSVALRAIPARAAVIFVDGADLTPRGAGEVRQTGRPVPATAPRSP